MFEFKLPDLGEGVHEGQVVNIMVQEGDSIDEFQPMMEVETDKAAVEIPAPKSGKIAKLHVSAGDSVQVGQVMVTIDESGTGGNGDGEGQATKEPDKAPAAQKEEPTEKKAAAQPKPQATPSSEAEAEPVEAAQPHELPAAHLAAEGPVPAAPVVRKLARELGVDIRQVPASGPGGRVLREDVERFAQGERRPSAPAEAGAPQLPSFDGELPDFSQHGPIRREKVPQIRKTIARQMTRAWLSVPRVTHVDTADITDLERNRKSYNATLAEGEAKLTTTALMIKVLGAALRRYPAMNASYDTNTDEIIYKDYVHIGVAVDTPRGLVVPVLRDADKKSLQDVAQELTQIGENARNVKFEIKDLRGATFSITNYGAVGGILGTPMVNFPECGILGMGRAKWQPAVIDGEIKPRFQITLSLSFDHRIVDGADAARFTTDVIRALENPLRLLSLA